MSVSAALPHPGLCVPADPFYERRQEEGLRAYHRGDYPAAVRALEVACFGMLDEPSELAGCLTHLALAQAGLDDRESFDGTVLRIEDVERRFGGYSKAALASAIRRSFEERLRVWVETDRLKTLLGGTRPVDAPLDASPATEEATPAEPFPVEEPPVEEPSIEEPPAEEPPIDEPPVDEPPIEEPQTDGLPAGRPPAGGSAEPAPLLSPIPEDAAADLREELEEARRLLRSSDRRDELREAFDGLRTMVERYPEHRELRYLTAEVAYRLRLWETTVEYFREAGGKGPERPDRQFYLAVAFFEMGDREAANRELDRCLPRLQPTAFVREYAARIRGEVDMP